MQPITIQKTLVDCGDACVVLATDSEQRFHVGASHGQSDEADFVFVRIDRVTMLELERGAVDLSTAMAKRRAGTVVKASDKPPIR
jgi:ferric-dicitrate binding protein FerR (iron transport regulator)